MVGQVREICKIKIKKNIKNKASQGNLCHTSSKFNRKRFNTVNVLLTKQQAFLLLDTVTARLFIHITGPLNLFVQATYIKFE